jgi:hypothetical protein
MEITPIPQKPHEAQYEALVEYLRQKTTARDWHAVSDAACDLRVLVAQHPDLERPCNAAS